MSVTLRDIAREAGVSISTVAHVLGGERSYRFKPETAGKVRDIARRLNYQHNAAARMLRSGKSQTIGVLTLTMWNEVAISKLAAVSRIIDSKGYRSHVRDSEADPQTQAQAIQEYAGSMVEGVVLLQGGVNLTDQVLEPLLSRNIPIVGLDPVGLDQSIYIPYGSVGTDRKYGAYIAVKHLLELGHRRIGLIRGDLVASLSRVQGYGLALCEYGIGVDESLIVQLQSQPDRDGYEIGYLGAKEWLSRRGDATALFCNNDEVAVSAIRAMREEGIRVPEDIAVVGFNNFKYGAYLSPSLTTVAHPAEELAKIAVEMLFQRIDNPSDHQPPQNMLLPPSLVIRESSGNPVTVEDR